MGQASIEVSGWRSSADDLTPRFHEMIELAPVGCCLIGFDGRITFANRAFAALLGYSADELRGHSIHDMAFNTSHSDDERPGFLDIQLDNYRGERQVRCKSGARKWVLVSAALLGSVPPDRPAQVMLQFVSIEAQKASEVLRSEQESRLRFALDGASQGVWDHDLRKGTVFFSPTWHEMRGYGVDDDIDALAGAWFDRMHPDDRERIRAITVRQNTGEIARNAFEYRERHRDGHWMWVLSRGKPVEWNADGSVARILGTDTDITALKEVESQLAAEKERLRITLHSIGDGMIATDRAGAVTFINPAAEELTGWPLAEAIGRPVQEIFKLRDERIAAAVPDPVCVCMAEARQILLEEDLVMCGRECRETPIRCTASPVVTEVGGVVGAVLVFQDTTQSQMLKRQLTHSANHDVLTGLPNRAAFEQALQRAAAAARDELRQHALCFIDLDHFKAVNDGAGHAAGDIVLQQVAKTIRQCCRTDDFLARIGGDEFMLIVSDCSLENGRGVAQKIVDAVGALEFRFADHSYRIGASIGLTRIAFAPPSPAALTEEADAACYAAKAAGRGKVVVHGALAKR
jgi:diguanylate cyclase (GGDEF)-like protein/PAS domain S-box-containing protein